MKMKSQVAISTDEILNLVSSMEHHEKSAEQLFRKLVLVNFLHFTIIFCSKSHPRTPLFLRQLAIFLRELKDEREEAEALFIMADEYEDHSKDHHPKDTSAANSYSTSRIRFNDKSGAPSEVAFATGDAEAASRSRASSLSDFSFTSAGGYSSSDRNTLLTYRQRVDSTMFVSL